MTSSELRAWEKSIHYFSPSFQMVVLSIPDGMGERRHLSLIHACTYLTKRGRQQFSAYKSSSLSHSLSLQSSYKAVITTSVDITASMLSCLLFELLLISHFYFNQRKVRLALQIIAVFSPQLSGTAIIIGNDNLGR